MQWGTCGGNQDYLLCLKHPNRACGVGAVECGATLMHHPLHRSASAGTPKVHGQGTSIRCGRSSGPVPSTVAIAALQGLAAGSGATAGAGSGLGTKVWGCALSDTSSTGHPEVTFVQGGVIDSSIDVACVIDGLQGEDVRGVSAITFGLHTSNQHALSAVISSAHTDLGIHWTSGTVHVVQKAPVVTTEDILEAAAVGSTCRLSGGCNRHGLSIC